jgi:hypothetical protein
VRPPKPPRALHVEAAVWGRWPSAGLLPPWTWTHCLCSSKIG